MTKKLTKVGIFAIIMVMLLNVTPPIEAQANSTVKLNKKSVTIAVGKTYTLKTKGTSKKATWKTSKKSVAKITAKKAKSVKITAVKVGTTTVTAKIGKKTYKCKVTVVNPKISKSKLNLTVGNKSTLKVTGGTGKVTWKSANTKIATVSSKGVITAKKAGTVKITARRNSKNLNCTVTIKAKPKAPAKPTVAPKPTKKPTVTPKPTKKPTATPAPTKKPNPTSTPKPTNKPAGAISPTETDYGYQKLAKNAQGHFMYDGDPIYYYNKEDMPYTFRVGDRLPNNAPDAPYLKRRWKTTSPNMSHQRRVTDKGQSEWECTCYASQGYTEWGHGYKTTNGNDFDNHTKNCGSNWRVNTIIHEQHEEQTVGGYWEYYNDYTDTWR